MAPNRPLTLAAELPERYGEFDVLASTIDHQGRLVALLVDPRRHTAPGQHWRLPVVRYDAVAVICDGRAVHEIALRDLDQWFSEIDTVGDGVVIAAARCHPVDIDYERWLDSIPEEEFRLPANLRIFDADGKALAAFYIGDAIEQLMSDPYGRIWTGYFDESSYWAPNPDGTRSHVSMPGLARWDSSGTPWFAPPHTPGVVWMDCYAMNVGRDSVYACPYTDFPLVEIDSSDTAVVTPNPVTRCGGLAVSGPDLAFLDQRRDGEGYRWEIRRASRGNGTITETTREPLLLPGGRQPNGWARGKIGRDETLWMREDGDERRWYRYELEG
ncbi:hypothetical protein GV794_15850 [Nocardia cyriacigeorgica]|uniref:Uncharacterized protein n=1 Tax=Nocardia cyriacigeorgica TaxID=135487 RepID=A0ABX0CMH9_9NOCA|nr:hypothetical protein [Nocardia cyriacigeorgica]NEW42122.1 hypothetical protein [Nocardia cyriacigeorgica]NEW53072.1 hypothetical protein [Nocardia cyriacigeorgica]NEW57117.1 hypothetical protein [Nocardia cyriacigeorgica]